jgi:hypothetical protein
MARKNRSLALIGVLAMAAFFGAVLFGTVSAAPAFSGGLSAARPPRD